MFLSWLFDEKTLHETLPDALNGLLSEQFIRETLVAGLLSRRVWIQPRIIEPLSNRVTDMRSSAPQRGTGEVTWTTVPKPFNLTRPKPKPLIASKIEPMPKARPVPTTTYAPHVVIKPHANRATSASSNATRNLSSAGSGDVGVRKSQETPQKNRLPEIRRHSFDSGEISQSDGGVIRTSSVYRPPPPAEVKQTAAAILRGEAVCV